jgi:hypothetical protein
MKSSQRVLNKEKFIKYLYICTFLFLMNNFIAFGSEDKSKNVNNNLKDYKFEEIYFLNSIPFEEYDNFESQLKTSLGLNSALSKTSYQDLSIIETSEALRKIYRSKLNDMILNE